MVRWLLIIAVAAGAVGACTLFDEEPPDDTCSTDTDCFRAQGETCNQQTRRCEVIPGGVFLDAAVLPDAAVDAVVSDAEVDAL